MKRLLVKLINLYKSIVSPLLVLSFGNSCRFTPTCSVYTRDAVESYGVIKGLYLGLKRIIRCNPFFEAGYDPLAKMQ